jgi:hypothetical protein
MNFAGKKYPFVHFLSFLDDFGGMSVYAPLTFYPLPQERK